MKGCPASPRTADQQRHAERIIALRSGDVAQMRAWAAKWGVHLFGDDTMLLWSIHDTRVSAAGVPRSAQAESREWLKTHPRPEEQGA